MPKSVGKLKIGANPTDKPNIGKTGPGKTTTSTAGRQYGFMPGPNAAPNGGQSRRSVSPGKSNTSGPGRQHSFLPKSYNK